MIPTKLYIPTSTLNFNNIMSSESISPTGFYSKRGFGYKRFEKTEQNNLDNRVVLYEKYPLFDINDDGAENYPMVIEVDTKTIKEYIIQEYKNGVFYSEETIYFNPFLTKVYFRNESEKRSTLSKAEPSIESKMVILYQNCFDIQPAKIESFDWIKNDIKDSKNDNSNHISKDRKINKLKGCLYAYILATNKSLSNEEVVLKKQVKNLRNILSAVITSPNGQATGKQQEQFKITCETVSNVFYKAEGFDKKIQNIAKEYFKDNKFEEFIAKFGNSWLPKPTFQLLPFQVPNTINMDEKEKALERYISDLEGKINRFAKPKHIQKVQVPALSHCNRIESVPIEKGDFLTELLNECLEETYNGKDFIHSRYEFAFTVIKNTFKKKLGEKWDDSEARSYLNNLLVNLKEGGPFELNSTNKPIPKSFAAFCQKGDTDIDKLEDYLISNEIGDFRIAFALWGVIFGFANMPKTLTSDLFSSNNLDYVSDVYKYIFKQLHDIDLEGKLEKKQEKRIVTVPSRMNKEIIRIEETKQRADETEYRERLKQVTTKKPQIDLVIGILKENNFAIDKSLELISNTKGYGKTSKIFKAIKECLKSSLETPTPTLDFDAPEKEFYLDADVLFRIKDVVPKNKQKDVKVEIDWIQKVHKEGGYEKKSGEWVKLTDHSNREVFKHLENNSKKTIGEKLMNDIIAKLRELYSN